MVILGASEWAAERMARHHKRFVCLLVVSKLISRCAVFLLGRHTQVCSDERFVLVGGSAGTLVILIGMNVDMGAQ